MFYSVLFLWPHNVFVLKQEETKNNKGMELFGTIGISESILGN